MISPLRDTARNQMLLLPRLRHVVSPTWSVNQPTEILLQVTHFRDF